MSAQPHQLITAAEVAAQKSEQRKLIPRFAERYGVDADKLLETLSNTAFKVSGGVSPAQMMALLVVAEAHRLNPFTREIFAFPSQNGIVPVVSVDGWAKLINEHPQFDGMDFEQDDEKCTCTIYRKDRSHPVRVTEYFAECKRPTGPWTSHPKRMLRHKTLIQAARIAFSFAGIFDQDEAERIVEAEEINVTPTVETLDVPEGTAPKRIGYAKLREIVEAITKATENGDGPGLLKVWDAYDNEQKLFIWGSLRSWERSAFKKLEAEARKAVGRGELPPWSIELLKSCRNAAELDKAWASVQEAFLDADQEIPDNVVTTCDEMRSSMGAN